jgi:hypothetical protein
MNVNKKKAQFSRKMVAGFLMTALLMTAIIPSAVMANSSNGGGWRF